MSAYAGSSKNLKDLKDSLNIDLLPLKAGPSLCSEFGVEGLGFGVEG